VSSAGAAHDERLYLALDQGGSSSRALVFDAAGAVVARAHCTVGEARPAPERVEQDGEELVRSLQQVTADVLGQLGPRAAHLAAAGLATQRSSLAAWSRRDGRALAPVLSWQDRRAAAWLARFAPDEADIVARTGLRLSPHYGASKFAWLLEHDAAVRAARAREELVLGPLASFLVFRLSRARPCVADPANASRTLLWSLATRDWDPSLAQRFGVPLELLPRAVPTRADFGELELARVPWSVLTGDQSAALFAAGEPDPETLYINLGTGGFVQRPVRGTAPAVDGLLRSVVHADERTVTMVLEGTINGVGSALAHVAAELGVAHPEPLLEQGLERPGDLPLFLNGVSGLAAPYWRSDFRTRFLGTGDAPAQLAAVAESVAFLVRAIAVRLSAALGRARRIRASGGLARSDTLCQLLADVLVRPVERSDEPEATARGLAWLLGARATSPIPPRIFEPGPRSATRLARGAQWTRELETALRTG